MGFTECEYMDGEFDYRKIGDLIGRVISRQ